ncbi:MerR family transcriptional regulator [Clostridium nigeriense]|uniref:MerR family transcriptional regulator n=1 Tax=Clostridium nigeriense TaxID=1805470 RepID=UPI0008359356|nr:MerR family transcriptional regulator [Clostridium nigeriense]
MLINEVCNITGLTKKAISYYEKQGLIRPIKASNGYRDYSKEDINLLNEISLYRKLDISINDIKIIVSSTDKKHVLNKIIDDKKKREAKLKIEKIYLEKLINNNFDKESIRELNEEIMNIEKSNGEFIKREMVRAFPSGLGKYLSHHFSPYLNEPLDTLEKYNAWIRIVEFLDSIPEIKVPKFIEMSYENITDEMQKQINDNVKDEMNRLFSATKDELEDYKKTLVDRIEKQNSKSLLKIMTPFYKFKKQINEFFSSSGYYDILIPNMKILSSEYREYHNNLMELNNKLSKELGIKYDENMRIVIDNK